MAAPRLRPLIHMPRPRKPRSKYGAVAVVIDGQHFDSMAEAKRWETLRLHERIGEISNLRRQVRYPLTVNSILVGHYKADFVYVENGAEVIEESKGFFDTAAKLRIRLFEAIYGVTVRITGAAAKSKRPGKRIPA